MLQWFRLQLFRLPIVSWLIMSSGCAVVLYCINLFVFSMRLSTLPSLRQHTTPPFTFTSSQVQQYSHIANQTIRYPRGIVLPLFDDIAVLGISLLFQLLLMNISLPIEIPHCGDLNTQLFTSLSLEQLRIYDVCELAATAYPRVFCMDLYDCHDRFRSFNIKILALVLSQFNEVMLMDADTLFFTSPMEIWTSVSYTTTGTLFFHDRISYEQSYLAKRSRKNPHISAMQEYLASFDVHPFRTLPTLNRSTTPLARLVQPIHLLFEPTSFLLTSHSWTLRAGHQMDSSLLLWNKQVQVRATAILASMIAVTPSEVQRPPSYGDKEYYFLACELAETQYSFSKYGVGTIGTSQTLQDYGPDQSILCGDALHYYPESSIDATPRPFFINSDMMLTWSEDTILYRTVAHPASWHASQSFTARGLSQTCPFEITAVVLSTEERQQISKRQLVYQQVVEWKTTQHHPLSLFYSFFF